MLARAEQMLFIPDLLNYFLTGKRATEYTIASTGMLLDAAKRDFAFELTDKLGIRRSLFAPIVQPGTDLGELLPESVERSARTASMSVPWRRTTPRRLLSPCPHRARTSSTSAPAHGR